MYMYTSGIIYTVYTHVHVHVATLKEEGHSVPYCSVLRCTHVIYKPNAGNAQNIHELSNQSILRATYPAGQWNISLFIFFHVHVNQCFPQAASMGLVYFTSCHTTQTSVYYMTFFFFFTDSVEEDKMLAEGVSRFCDDANLDPTSLTVLILAWKFKAATQCEFSRKEFVEGMAELG